MTAYELRIRYLSSDVCSSDLTKTSSKDIFHRGWSSASVGSSSFQVSAGPNFLVSAFIEIIPSSSAGDGQSGLPPASSQSRTSVILCAKVSSAIMSSFQYCIETVMRSEADRKSGVKGRSGSLRVNLGGRG